MPKYDVVVVGAGLAGLSSALQTAIAGKKVLLIEQHNLPGGCATSFVRGRFDCTSCATSALPKIPATFVTSSTPTESR